jgi:hypothetical protein
MTRIANAMPESWIGDPRDLVLSDLNLRAFEIRFQICDKAEGADTHLRQNKFRLCAQKIVGVVRSFHRSVK